MCVYVCVYMRLPRIRGEMVEWSEVSDVEQMWKQLKQAVVDSAREVCLLLN